tara:strand:- start:50 stop:364 length:315 start_codon:yes stop_codon:yes gene_type:complete
MSGKPTVKQMQGEVASLKNELSQFANALVQEVMKHNTLIYAMLSDMGKMEKIICENCGEEVARPVLKDIENTDDCPSCGKSLFITKQADLEDLSYLEDLNDTEE